MKALTEAEISAFVEAHTQWRYIAGVLTRGWEFPDFVAAMAFVNRVAELAEAAGHHPDFNIRYNRVRLSLSTHDAGGITDRDTAMADQLDAVS